MTSSLAHPDASPTRLKVSTPGDLLGLIPYLLGFPPQESLVLLLIGEGQVRLTARLDLPPPDVSATRAAPLVVQQLSDLADRTAADALVLLAYSSRPEPARQLLELLAVALEPLGLIDAV